MAHVAYNKDTTRLLNKTIYATRGAAKAGLTRAAKADSTLIKADYDVAEYSMFSNFIEKMVTKKNLLSGKEYEERENTPISCSPASETYWSM